MIGERAELDVYLSFQSSLTLAQTSFPIILVLDNVRAVFFVWSAPKASFLPCLCFFCFLFSMPFFRAYA